MTEIQNKIITAFQTWIEKSNDNDFVVVSHKGELNAQAILKEMKKGSEFGLNFLNSIEKMVFNIPEDCSIISGNGELFGPDIVKEMKEGTDFGPGFLASSLEVTFDTLKLSFTKKSEQ